MATYAFERVHGDATALDGSETAKGAESGTRAGVTVEILCRPDLLALARRWRLRPLARATAADGWFGCHATWVRILRQMRESAIIPLADSDFRIEEEHPRSGTAVLALHGDADLHSANELRVRLGAAIEAGATTLAIDLSEVTFIDSMALGVLLETMKRLRARGGVLRIVGPRPDVRRIFEITLLDRVFPIDATRSEALAAGAGDARP